MSTPSDDPWKHFPGGNPFGPNGPLGGPLDPMAGMDKWLRDMGIDPAEFRGLVDDMQRGLQDALRSMGQEPGRSFVSGFNVRVGPDGKPRFSTFGDRPKVASEGGMPSIRGQDREPLTDVLDEGPQVSVTMELPGVDKKDIDLHMTERRLEVGVDTDRRKYHKLVKLPAKVDPQTTKATFKNGILDVTVQKLAADEPGVRIDVE